MPQAVLGVILMLLWLTPASTGASSSSVLWQQFQRHLLSNDGRVVDFHTPKQHTTSEGQAYALFMALVMNDQTRFDQLLRWTENNLAQGDLGSRLPAWQWGRIKDDEWGVIDANSASDADLWMAYSLAEAGRLWCRPRLGKIAHSLARRILREETADLPGLGLMLLPGPQGFSLQSGRWRLNPSYLPLQLLRRFERLQPGVGWEKILENTVAMLKSSRRGFVPDWIVYDTRSGFVADTKYSARGSYDAIRVYLWAAMLHEDDPYRPVLLELFRPMAEKVKQLGGPPRSIDTETGASTGFGPAGFSAALMPLLKALQYHRTLALVKQQASGVLDHPDHYYDQMLALFGQGWMEGRYRFGRQGQLQPKWKLSCAEDVNHS